MSIAGKSGITSTGIQIMALRFENLARYAVSFVGAATVTVMLIANAVSMGPVA